MWSWPWNPHLQEVNHLYNYFGELPLARVFARAQTVLGRQKRPVFFIIHGWSLKSESQERRSHLDHISRNDKQKMKLTRAMHQSQDHLIIYCCVFLSTHFVESIGAVSQEWTTLDNIPETWSSWWAYISFWSKIFYISYIKDRWDYPSSRFA